MGFPLLLNKALAEVKKHGMDICTSWILWGHVQSGRVGFPLLLNKTLSGFKNHKALKCRQEAWIWDFHKLHSFEEGPVQSGQVGFPLLLNKALAGVKKHGLDVCTRWTLWGHVQSGQVGFPLLLNKAVPGVKKHVLDVCTRCSLWGHVQSGQVGFPLLLNVSCNFTNSQVGTRSLEVLLSMLYVVWRNHHMSWGTFWKNLNHENGAVPRDVDLPILVVLCPRHGGWGATGSMLLADGKRPLRYTNDPSEQRST